MSDRRAVVPDGVEVHRVARVVEHHLLTERPRVVGELFFVQRVRERDRHAVAHQLQRLLAFLIGDEVERAALIGRAPAAPIGGLFHPTGDVVVGDARNIRKAARRSAKALSDNGHTKCNHEGTKTRRSHHFYLPPHQPYPAHLPQQTDPTYLTYPTYPSHRSPVPVLPAL